MLQKANLSVCIIARDEEKMIGDCLRSVAGIADEIILVDTGSVDATPQIAATFNCRMIHRQWENDFSKARNIALDAARYPYILVIDADERLENPEIVHDMLMLGASNVGGWLVEVVSRATRADGSIDTYVSKLLRLFRSHPGVRFSGIIHEQIIEPILRLGYKLDNSPLKLIHLGYGHSVDQMRIKQQRNLALLNVSLESNPGDAYSYYQRAKTHLALGDLIAAEKDIAESLRLADPAGAVRPQALNYGAVIAYQSGDYELATRRSRESLGIIARQSFANFILGESLTASLDFAGALTAYRAASDAMSAPDVMASIVGDYHLPAEQMAFRLGRSLVALHNYDEAKEEFERGLGINPDDISCTVGLANVAFARARYDEALSLLAAAQGRDPGRQDIRGFIRQVEAAARQAQEGLAARPVQSYPMAAGQDDSTEAKPLVSLCMIVKNEEKMLPDCLESVRGIAGELIIVDTGSSDSTKDIALRYGAQVFDFAWVNDFARARNEALRHCRGEWILYLDADERLKIDDPVAFSLMLKNTGDETGGYVCTIESNHMQLDGAVEHHRGGYPRLFRNYGYPRVSFQGRVHEQIAPALFALGKSIAMSDIIIEHLGYNQSREIMEQKIRRNYTMLIEHVKEEPLSAYAWYQLGQTLAQMSLLAEAEKAIRFSIETGKLSDSVYASATATLAQLVGNRRQFEESLFWAERSLGKAPRQVYALNLKAFSLLYLNRPIEAEEAFLEVQRRLAAKKGVPQSGFDIDIPAAIVQQGLDEARSKAAGNHPGPPAAS